MAVDQAVNEERIAQARVNVRGSLRVFSVYFWHSEGWTPRSEALLEAVVKQARVTKHVVGENVSKRCSRKVFRSDGTWMHAVAPKEASTCRSKAQWVS